jgi:hypothetical protein
MKDIATKTVRDGAIIAGHTALQKKAGDGIFMVLKKASKPTTIWISKKAVAKVGLVGYGIAKAIDAGIYIHKRREPINQNGLGKTVVQDLKKGFKEHPFKTVARIVL